MEYVPIFDSPDVILSGNARCVKEQSMLLKKAVRLSSVKDSFSVKVAGRQVGIILFKHEWSGIAEVVVGEQVHAIDLFSTTPMHWLLEVPLPSSPENVLLTIRPSGKKNDAAHASEIWIEGVYTCTYLISELEERIRESVQQPPFREADLNQLTDVFKWYDPEWRTALESLKTSPPYKPPDFVHRKSWEWGQCLYGLDRLGMLRPEYRALGIGVGWEPISYFLSNFLGEVIATDLYPTGTNWSDSGAREGNPEILENPDKYAPFPYRKDRLRFMRMDGTRLEFPDESFDVVWSCSSIEHFGGHENAARSMQEIERVLNPGGVAAIITEFVLPDSIGGSHSSFHPEFFNLRCLYHYLIRSVPRLHLVQDIDFSIPKYYVRRACRLPEEAGAPHKGSMKPHIVLSQQGCLFTSIAMFFRKEGVPPNNSQQRLFAIGEGNDNTPIQIRSSISLEESERFQRDHMTRMRMDAIQTPESKIQLLESMHRRYETYLSDLFLEGSGRILDVGCGYAEIWFRLVRERGFTYYGVDLNEDVVDFMANLLKCQGNEEYMKKGMLEQIPYPDQFFDVVYASHILEHTVDIAQALAEIRRVMKDDGYLVFAVPCGPDDEPAHLHTREEEGWIEDLTSNGFVIEKSGRMDLFATNKRQEFYGRAVKAKILRRKPIECQQEQLQAIQKNFMQQRLQAIETSRIWRIGRRVARSWAGRLWRCLMSHLRC